MHCVSLYPTPIGNANLRSIPFLADRFGLRTGYSNHVVEPEAVMAAVALGACMIEVHFTDCKEGRDFRDHELSADPDDLARLSKSIKRVRCSLGEPNKEISPGEIESRPLLRKGLVAARDLQSGAVLSENDIMFARPATGFETSRSAEIVGKTLSAPLIKGEQIRPDGLLEV